MRRVLDFVRFFQSGINFFLLACLALPMLAPRLVLAAHKDDPKPAPSIPAPAPSPAKAQNAASASNNTSAGTQAPASASQGVTAQTNVASPAITFVQITDAHLFDGGKKRETAAEAQAEQKDTWNAFRWAIRQTNALIDGGAQIDFVVFTGDMGLDFVRDLPPKPPCFQGKPDADFDNERSKGWLKFYTPKEAAQAVADEFGLLKVKTIYLIPGNNDLMNEDPCDLDRWRNFVKQTAAAISNGRPKLVDLTRDIAKASDLDAEGPFRLLGLNSAGFKKSANYATCGYDKDGIAGSLQNLPGCPRYEIDKISNLTNNNDGLFLVFTHIPDVIDPLQLQKDPQNCSPAASYSKRDKNDKLCGSWAVTGDVHTDWENLVDSKKIVAVFAGHLHDARRTNYATTVDNTPLYNGAKVAEKTWIAPPLALKYQDTQCVSCRARGLLLVRVQKNVNRPGAAVSVIPFWYLGENCNCGEILKIIAWIAAVVAVVILLFWIVANRENEIVQQFATALLSPQALTLIGLAIIFVIFRELLKFITEELSVPRYYYLVLFFGAFGGLIGSIRYGNELIWVSFEKSRPFRLGLLGDILLGMGGATAISLMFDNPLHIKDNDSSETMLLISISFIAGVVGRNLVQAASNKLLRQVADDAAQKAVDKVKAEQAVATNQTPANQSSQNPAPQPQPGNESPTIPSSKKEEDNATS